MKKSTKGIFLMLVITTLLFATVSTVSGTNGCQLELPDKVSMQIPIPPTKGGQAYFQQVIITNGGILNGTYQGWCIDTDAGLSIGDYVYHNVSVYCSYDDLPEGLVEFPENLSIVNWIINQDFVGQQSTCNGSYTYGDVQKAIWELLEDNPMGSGLGPWDQCRVDEILEVAIVNGDGFVPECGDKVAIILKPGPPGTHQTLIIEVEIQCEGEEGLTPGFWKNHPDAWADTPYDPDSTTLGDVFSSSKSYFHEDDTMLQALSYKGGPRLDGAAKILLRAAVAAVLNAAHPLVNYPLTLDEIIYQVNSALDSEDRDTMLDLAFDLDTYNNYGCDDFE
jgi:hypothetical protein